MSATTELITSRWNSGLAVSGGPGINNLEAVIKLITGIPYETVISGGLGLDVECKFTKPVFTKGTSTAGQAGFRCRDTTNSKDCIVQVIGNWVHIYDNTGTEASPTWVRRHSFNRNIGPAAAKAYMNVAPQTIPNLTGTAITFDGESYDYGGMWVAGSPRRLTAPYGGIYQIEAGLKYANSATGDRSIIIYKNAFGVAESINSTPALNAAGTITQTLKTSFQLDLVTSDYLELYSIHSAGAALDVSQAWLSAVCLVPIPA